VEEVHGGEKEVLDLCAAIERAGGGGSDPKVLRVDLVGETGYSVEAKEGVGRGLARVLLPAELDTEEKLRDFFRRVLGEEEWDKKWEVQCRKRLLRGEYRNGFVAALGSHADCSAVARLAMGDLGLLRADGTMKDAAERGPLSWESPAVAVVALTVRELQDSHSELAKEVVERLQADFRLRLEAGSTVTVHFNTKRLAGVLQRREVLESAARLCEVDDPNSLSVLLALQPDWDKERNLELVPPGGKRKLCEKAVDCAAREADEEVHLSRVADVRWSPDAPAHDGPDGNLAFRLAAVRPKPPT
jgi:hypothetical protein